MKNGRDSFWFGAKAGIAALAIAAFVIAISCDSNSRTIVEGVEGAETAAVMGKMTIESIGQLMEMDFPMGDVDMAVAEANIRSPSLKTRVLKNLRLEPFLKGTAEGTLAATAPCPDGGTISENCSSNATSTTMSVVANNCVVVTDEETGEEMRMSGSVTITVNVPGGCEEADIDDADTIEISFNNYRISVVDDTHGTIVSMRMHGSMWIYESDEVGCDMTHGEARINLQMEMSSIEDDEENFRMRVDNLEVVMGGTAEPCEDTMTLNGSIGVENLSSGENLYQTFTDFVVTQTSGEGTTFVALDGQASTPCMGSVTFETLEPLDVSGDGCPPAGLIEVTQASTGETSSVQFNDDGSVDIDVGADGEIDLTLDDCDDLEEQGDCQR